MMLIEAFDSLGWTSETISTLHEFPKNRLDVATHNIAAGMGIPHGDIEHLADMIEKSLRKVRDLDECDLESFSETFSMVNSNGAVTIVLSIPSDLKWGKHATSYVEQFHCVQNFSSNAPKHRKVLTLAKH